jgi:hypothetical protein
VSVLAAWLLGSRFRVPLGLWMFPFGFIYCVVLCRRVFENRGLRRIFGPNRDNVTEERRKLHSEEVHKLYSTPNIIRQIKARSMRWAGHVALM